MSSNTPNILSSWKVLDTGHVFGGAVSLAETDSHLYLARCEYGRNPYNVGLYAYQKNSTFNASNFVFLGNLADEACAGGGTLTMNTSLLRDRFGTLVVRWAFTSGVTTGSADRWFVKQIVKRGFSALTPGGLVELQSDTYEAGRAVALPTLISREFSNRALLYWYELDAMNQWSVKGAISDGIGKWSAPFALSNTTWARTFSPNPDPWTWSGDLNIKSGPQDYMKGSYVLQNGKMRFLAQWIQPVVRNEIFYATVE